MGLKTIYEKENYKNTFFKINNIYIDNVNKENVIWIYKITDTLIGNMMKLIIWNF